MPEETLYIGFFIAGGKLRECCAYPSEDVAHGTLLESMKEWHKKQADCPEQYLAITEHGVVQADTDGSWSIT